MDNTNENIKRRNISIDIAKIFLALFVVASHSLPLFNERIVDHFFFQGLFRFCVPFFFICTGYFFIKMDEQKQKNYIIKILLMYLISTLLFLPLLLRDVFYNGFETKDISYLILNLIFGYQHLWYLSATIIACLLFMLLNKITKNNQIIIGIIALILFIFGIFFDEYCVLFNNQTLLDIKENLKYIGTTRNALCFAFPMIYLGSLIHKIDIKNNIILVLLFFISIGLLLLESWIFVDKNPTLDLSFSCSLPALFLFIICINNPIYSKNLKLTYYLGHLSTIIYIIHPLILHGLHYANIPNYLDFILACLISTLIALAYIFVQFNINKKLQN